MNKFLKKSFEYFMIAILAVMSALCYVIFIFPNSFAPAGFNGIATMIQYITGTNVGYLSLLFNVPLIVAVFFLVDKEFALKTMVFILAFSGGLILMDEPFLNLDQFIYRTDTGTSTILGPVVSGILTGAILGVVILFNSCSGGTELVALLIHKYKPSYNFAWVTFVLNSAVAIASYFVYDFEIEPVILCILFSFFYSNVSDRMLKGSREAIKFEIITDYPEEISEEIIQKLGHPATFINAEGCYTHDKKGMLMCIINKDQIVKLKQILSRYPDTFACISNVSSTVGKFSDKRKKSTTITE